MNSNLPLINYGVPTTLILGDSHVGSNLNPVFIPGSINVACGAEDISFSYYKLKKLINAYPSIKTVIMSWSYHQLYIQKGFSNHFLNRYQTILDNEFYEKKLTQEKFNYVYLLRYISNRFQIPLGVSNDIYDYVYYGILNRGSKSPFLGSFNAVEGNSIDEVYYSGNPQHRHYYRKGKLITSSPMRKYYLRECVDVCLEKRIRLYLINAPVHKSYYAIIPEGVKNEVDSLAISLENDTTFYMNFSQMSLPDSYFADYHHLNSTGSEYLSKYFNDSIRSDRSGDLYSY